jgi:hypothetical protein
VFWRQLERKDRIIGLEYCGKHRSSVVLGDCPTTGTTLASSAQSFVCTAAPASCKRTKVSPLPSIPSCERRAPLQIFDARRSLILKLERVFGERVTKDAGNPSGARHFTISTALGNERCEENQHEYDGARS